MRTGKVFFVIVAVLAMAGAAGAQTPQTPMSCEDLIQYGVVTVVDFEDIASGLGGINAVNLTDPYTEFPGITLSRGSATGLWVGEPDSANSNNCTGFYGNDFFPVSGTAVFSPENCDPSGGDSGSPVGSVIVDFDNPAFAVGLSFLDPEGAQSSIKAYDGPLGTGNLLGIAIAQNEPDNAQAFRFLNSDGNIQSLVIQLGGGDDGVGMDDLCYVTAPSFEVNLCAAQEIPAGNVTVEQNGDILTVNYAAASGYEFNEIHVDVGCIVDGDFVGIPVNKQDQPKIGNFAYSVEYDEPVTMDSFDFNLCDIEAEGCSLDNLIVAAHAVVTDVGYCEAKFSAYGVNRPAKKLYGLDLATPPSAVELFLTDTGTPDNSQPNGLAFDVAKGRLYYSSASKDDAPSTLWFWDGVAEANAGNLTGFVAGAEFYNGKYYYIENRTDDVRVVTLDDLTGNVESDVLLWEGFTGDPDLNFRFGDIAIDADGILYGNAQKLSGPGTNTDTVLGVEFFTIDLADGTYTARGSFLNAGGTRQLAFGSDGILYGHNAGGGMFYVIDPTNGAETPIGAVGLEFTDLASGELCVPPTETAWGGACEYDGTTPGEGYRFVNRGSWATYFEYTVYDPPMCDGIE